MKQASNKIELSPKEYVFSRKSVPDTELLACRLWEYARESPTIRGLMETVAALEMDGVRAISKGYRNVLHLALAIWSGAGKMPLAGRAYFPPAAKISTPWQDLPPGFRREVGRQFHLPVTPKGEKKKIYPAGFEDAMQPEFNALANLRRSEWDMPLGELLKTYGSRKRDFEPMSLKVEWNEGPLLPTRRSETRAFTFNWRCRNEQIEAAFRMWLQKNRPPEWANDAKGEKVTSLRVDLERLGMMRKIKADPNQADAEKNKEARRALHCFRELFPTLTEHPLNWPWPVNGANTPQE
jgi:hypothetical protein